MGNRNTVDALAGNIIVNALKYQTHIKCQGHMYRIILNPLYRIVWYLTRNPRIQARTQCINSTFYRLIQIQLLLRTRDIILQIYLVERLIHRRVHAETKRAVCPIVQIRIRIHRSTQQVPERYAQCPNRHCHTEI